MADRVYEVVLATYAVIVTAGFVWALLRMLWWSEQTEHWHQLCKESDNDAKALQGGLTAMREEAGRWQAESWRLAERLADANDELDRLREPEAT